MQTVLITGANRGLGLGLVRHYLAAGWQVEACARKIDRNELADLAATNPALHLHKLDVTDHAAIDVLAVELKARSLDIIINNAGINLDPQQFGKIDYDAWRQVLEVNTISPTKLTEAFASKLKDGGKIAFISSLMGSIGDCSQGWYIYRTSKTALNMVAKLVSADMKPRNISVVTLHPGSVLTDMNEEGTVKIKDSASGMASVIDGLKLSQSGGFYDYKSKELPW